MKKKTIIYILIILMVVFSFNIKSYAATLPYLLITSKNYSEGEKITLEEVTSIEEGKTLQLYAKLAFGNDLYDPDDPDGIGVFVQKANLEGVTWTSSNTSVATIDNSGKLTGIKEGETVITADYPSGEREQEKTTEITINITKSENQPSQDQPSNDPNQTEDPSKEPNKTNTQTPTTTTSNDDNNSKTYKNGYSSIDEDKTVANVKIPKSGLNFTIMIISIIGTILIAIFSYKKYKNCTK